MEEPEMKEGEGLAQVIEILRDMKAELHALVEKHNETLYGNGVPGLTTRVAIMERNWKVVMFMLAAAFSAGVAAFF